MSESTEEMASLQLPDDLLAEIFLRLPVPADLVRASAACVSFRRAAADRSFLRRYRKLHAPPLLGFLEYERKVFHPAVPPHPSASAARAAALAADFSFSFLPDPARDWRVNDMRDGRVLLDRHREYDHEVLFREMVVCDPLHRRYLLLPPIPDDLAATVEDVHDSLETFLLPPGNDEEASAAEETSFRVVWMAPCATRLVAFVFSSSTGQWRTISSQSWSNLLAGLPPLKVPRLYRSCQCSYGCFYWFTDWKVKLLVLDTRTMEFSIVEPPPQPRGIDVHTDIMEAGEGSPGIFVRALDKKHVNYFIRRNNCESSSKWQLEKIISLDYRHMFVGSTGRHVFLCRCQRASSDASYFSLDVKTFQLERVFVSNSYIPNVFAYSNFPPSLSTPTISSGVEEGAEKEMLEQHRAASSSAQSRRLRSDSLGSWQRLLKLLGCSSRSRNK